MIIIISAFAKLNVKAEMVLFYFVCSSRIFKNKGTQLGDSVLN